MVWDCVVCLGFGPSTALYKLVKVKVTNNQLLSGFDS